VSFNRKKHESFAALLDNPVTDYQRENIQFRYKDLINEHFDNPSLKFEELKIGMWVWDNKNHSWLKVIGFYGFNIHVQFGIGIHKNDCYVEYEENRFYIRQVKE